VFVLFYGMAAPGPPLFEKECGALVIGLELYLKDPFSKNRTSEVSKIWSSKENKGVDRQIKNSYLVYICINEELPKPKFLKTES